MKPVAEKELAESLTELLKSADNVVRMVSRGLMIGLVCGGLIVVLTANPWAHGKYRAE